MQTRKTKQKVTNPKEALVTLELILFTSGVPNTLSIFSIEVFNAGGSVLIIFHVRVLPLIKVVIRTLFIYFNVQEILFIFQRTPKEEKGFSFQKQIR